MSKDGKRQMNTDQSAFDIFWAQYPKKRSKGDAYKAWLVTAAKRPPLDELLKALTVLKASYDWMKDGGQFIPYPGHWLRAWGWEDVPEVELQGVHKGRMWWETASGIAAMASKHGMTWTGRYGGHLENFQQFTHRVRAIADKVTNLADVRDKKLESAGG